MASAPSGTLYVGVTSDLAKRVFEHKNDFVDGFTKTYKVHTLVYYETHEDIEAAIAREKQIKNWHRAYKINAITAFNPTWDDLYDSLFG
ncbi:MAG: GIY-YIG nuclease family protein [Clostridiales Family XIII bacterium]|nr:GIY-YIG nuclease family protein [Clostridiales Family XIII bacterium]